MCALACACGDDGPAGPPPEIEGTLADLTSPMAWQPQAADDDPFADHRPADVMCPFGLGWLVELGGFEVNTGACNYGGFVQPSLRDIVRGAELRVGLYHFDLLAPEPATAHVAIQIGDRLIFEREVAIPGKADIVEVSLVADFDAPAGTPVVFHLHNHGQNTWALTDLKVEVENP